MVAELGRPAKALLYWIGGTLIGWSLAGGSLLLVQVLYPTFSSPALFIVLLIPGAAQWLLLRRLVGISPIWVATAPLAAIAFVGIIISLPVTLWETVDSEAPATLAGIYAILGALLGLLQWLALRRQLRAAWVWVAASIVGIAAGFALALFTDLVNRSGLGTYVAVVLI
ncbi:MAG: hypothetical protein MUO38_12085, partial [Anaerolineales bacterium]|nr:hypothetical protein [Anaerolineales bacterium]